LSSRWAEQRRRAFLALRQRLRWLRQGVGVPTYGSRIEALFEKKVSHVWLSSSPRNLQLANQRTRKDPMLS
jgi:hypothetical protein